METGTRVRIKSGRYKDRTAIVVSESLALKELIFVNLEPDIFTRLRKAFGRHCIEPYAVMVMVEQTEKI